MPSCIPRLMLAAAALGALVLPGASAAVDNRAGGGSTIGAVIADPEFAAFLKTNAAQPAHSTPQALQQLLAKDVVRWTETAKRAGIQQQ